MYRAPAVCLSVWPARYAGTSGAWQQDAPATTFGVGELHIRRPSLATAKRKTAGAIDAVVERVEEVFSRDEQADRND